MGDKLEGGRWKVRPKGGEGGRGRKEGEERGREEWNTRKWGGSGRRETEGVKIAKLTTSCLLMYEMAT